MNFPKRNDRSSNPRVLSMTMSAMSRHSLHTLLAATLAVATFTGCGNTHPKATNTGRGGSGSGGKTGGGGGEEGGAGGDGGGEGGSTTGGKGGGGNGGSTTGGKGGGGNGQGGEGGSGIGGMAPPAACAAPPKDDPADAITITNNQIASPGASRDPDPGHRAADRRLRLGRRRERAGDHVRQRADRRHHQPRRQEGEHHAQPQRLLRLSPGLPVR
jgi:hypothetical protein